MLLAIGVLSQVYPQTPNFSEGLIPRAIICYMGIDPYVLFFEHQD